MRTRNRNVRTAAAAGGRKTESARRRKTQTAATNRSVRATPAWTRDSDMKRANRLCSSFLRSTDIPRSPTIAEAAASGRTRKSSPSRVKARPAGRSAAERKTPLGSSPSFAFSAAFSFCQRVRLTMRSSAPPPDSEANFASPRAMTGAGLWKTAGSDEKPSCARRDSRGRPTRSTTTAST